MDDVQTLLSVSYIILLILEGHFCPPAPASKRQGGQLPLLPPPPQFRRACLHPSMALSMQISFFSCVVSSNLYLIKCRRGEFSNFINFLRQTRQCFIVFEHQRIILFSTWVALVDTCLGPYMNLLWLPNVLLFIFCGIKQVNSLSPAKYMQVLLR